MRIAINGAGVAGPTLAWWLREFGHEPVLFERAAAPRQGGYVIDFWGCGYDVSERMGIVPGLREDGYVMERMKTVTAGGRTTSSINQSTLSEITRGRYLSVARSDIAGRILDACAGIECRFGTSVTGVDSAGAGVSLALSDGETVEADLLVGADGLHSAVRGLAFGPEERFERPIGCHVAAFRIPGYRPREELTYVMHTRPGRQISRVALRDDQTLILMVFADHLLPDEPADDPARRDALRRIYAGMEWETEAILSHLDDAADLYFDRVSQIRMPAWTTDRVALVGDAAACPSLLAGEGTGLGMTEAYVLAGEIARSGGDLPVAFAGYENRLRDFVRGKQDAALKFAGFFAPRNWPALILRDLLTNLVNLPGLRGPLLGASVRDDVDLPDYAAGQVP